MQNRYQANTMGCRLIARHDTLYILLGLVPSAACLERNCAEMLAGIHDWSQDSHRLHLVHVFVVSFDHETTFHVCNLVSRR